MQKASDAFWRTLNAIGDQAQTFDESTWCILAVATVVIGYFMLRGNMIGLK